MYKRIKELFLITGVLLAVGLFPAMAVAQSRGTDILELGEAVQIALENNYNIQIVRNEARLAENDFSPGNAGMFPIVSASASQTRSIEDSRTAYASENIPDNDITGARSTSTVAEISMGWTIFDGLGMFATYNKLGKLSVLGEQQARLQVEQTVAQVISMYYDIIRQKKTYAVLENTLAVTEERIRIAEVKADLGSGSQFDLLQARADLNADRAALLAQEVALQNSKVSLNALLGRNVNEAFVVADDIPLREQLNYANLVQSAISKNLDLAVARTGQDVLELELKEIQSERFPELLLNMSYGYGRNESGAGFLQFNETNGFNYGLTARVNLFDGFNTNRRAENARIRIKNQELAIDQQRQQVEADLTRVYQRYTNALRLVELESENLKYAEQSQEIALERFQLGTINSLELREAQRTLNNAENRLIQAEFEAKIAETELLRLSGTLTQPAGR